MKVFAALLVTADAASHTFNDGFSHYDVYGDIFGTVYQFAYDNGNVYNLGSFSHMTGNQIFLTGGTYCDDVWRGRKTTVNFTCGTPTKVFSVSEPSTCSYVITAQYSGCYDTSRHPNPCDTDNGGCLGNNVCTWDGLGSSPVCTCHSPNISVGADCVDPCATAGCSDGCSVVGTSAVCNCDHDALLRLDVDGKTCVTECDFNRANGYCSHVCNNPVNPGDPRTCSCDGTPLALSSNGRTCVEKCTIDNGGCSHVCKNPTLEGEDVTCSCDGTKLVLDPSGDQKTCEIEQCAWDMHGCDNDATCIEVDLDNAPTEKFCDHTAPPVSPNTACMNGYDSGTIQGIYTPEECAQLCQDDPACRAFEYRKAPNGRSTGTCFKWVKCTLFWPLSGLTYTKCEFPAEQVSTTCECNSPKTGDGYQCTYCPSHDECWNYNATTHTCSMEPSCSTLTCDPLNIDIEMEPELFGLTDPESAVWASIAQPTFSDDKLRYNTELGHSDQRVYMKEYEDKIVAEVAFSIGGNDRQRSAVRANEIDLGDMAVYTSNVGIQVLYRCEYPTNVDISSQAFDVQTVSAFGQNEGYGNLAGGFSMDLSSPTGDESRFIMGGQLQVAINWSARFLSQFSFRISKCSVVHGDTNVDVIKDGCYSGLLEAQPVEVDSNLSQQFIFNMFKALDEESQTQFISCEVKVCKDYCSTSLSKPGESDCPVDDVMNFHLP